MSGERVMGVIHLVLARRDGPYPAARAHTVKEAFTKEGGALLAGSMAITKGGPNLAGAKVLHRMGDQPRGAESDQPPRPFLRCARTSPASRARTCRKIKYHWWDAAEMDKIPSDQWTEPRRRRS